MNYDLILQILVLLSLGAMVYFMLVGIICSIWYFGEKLVKRHLARKKNKTE